MLHFCRIDEVYEGLVCLLSDMMVATVSEAYWLMLLLVKL